MPVASEKLTFGNTRCSSIATEPLLDEELELLELDELLEDELELELLLELEDDELLLDDELELLDELLELLLDEELEVFPGGLVTVQVGSFKLPSCVPWTPNVALWLLPRLPFQLQQLLNSHIEL